MKRCAAILSECGYPTTEYAYVLNSSQGTADLKGQLNLKKFSDDFGENGKLNYNEEDAGQMGLLFCPNGPEDPLRMRIFHSGKVAICGGKPSELKRAFTTILPKLKTCLK